MNSKVTYEKKNFNSIILCLIISSNYHLRKGNFFDYGGYGLINSNNLLEQYPHLDMSKISNNNYKISFGLNYAIINYLIISLYSIKQEVDKALGSF